jgi:hypothetical protein
MTSTNLTSAARWIVLAMSCGVALLCVTVFVVSLLQHDTLLEAVAQAAPLAAAAMLGMCGPAIAQRLQRR